MSSARGQSYAAELRQFYDVALRQQKRSFRQEQQQQSTATGCDDDEQSTTTSTSTVTTAVGALGWSCCGRRASDDGTTSIHGRCTEMGSGYVGRERGGQWSSAADCESIASCSDFATPGPSSAICGASAASVTAAVPFNQHSGPPTAIFPDVVTLTHNDKSQNSRELHCGSTANKPSKDDVPLFSLASYSAR